MTQAAILTGDLIASTEATNDAVYTAMDCLAEAAATLTQWYGYDTRFTRFRGDGWQVYLEQPGHTLRGMLLLLARLKSSGQGLETRLSIGVGSVEHLGELGLADAAGPAFVLSGRNLDKMGSFRTFVYADSSDNHHWPRAVLDLAFWQTGLWSREQAEAVSLAITPDRSTDQVLAKGLGITRQALQARLKGSGIASMSSALLAFEHFHPAQEPRP